MSSRSVAARSSSITLPSPRASSSESVIEVDPTSTDTRSETPASRSKLGAAAMLLSRRSARAALGASAMSVIVRSFFDMVDHDRGVAIGLADAAEREAAPGDGHRHMARHGKRDDVADFEREQLDEADFGTREHRTDGQAHVAQRLVERARPGGIAAAMRR